MDGQNMDAFVDSGEIMLKLGKKRKGQSKAVAPETDEGRISAQRGIAQVIRETCARGARFTITAETAGVQYVILVDRAGPFNANGPGVTGAAALAAAVRLRDGTYSVKHGWPVDQPLFQLGLDTTLRELEMAGPDARGPVPEAPAAASPPVKAPAPAAPLPAPQLAAYTPPSIPSSRPPAPAQTPPLPATPAAPASTSASPAPAASASTPYIPPPIYSPPVAPPLNPLAAPKTEVALVDRLVPPETPAAPEGPPPIIPGMPGTSQKQGQLKHLLTQALLWVVQVDEPDSYTLPQAWRLSIQAVRAGIEEFKLVAREWWQRYLAGRWRRMREDWKKSGEVVRRQRKRAAKPKS